MGFVHKTVLIGLKLVSDLVVLVCCGEDARTMVLCDAGALIVGSVFSHLAELYLRRNYAEKVLEKERKLLLEEHNEQLKTSNEHLRYDVQHRGRPFLDDERSAIRRGLQAEPNQPDYHMGATDPSEAGGPAPSDSATPSLPPAPPSSTGSGSMAPLTWSEAEQQWRAESEGVEVWCWTDGAHPVGTSGKPRFRAGGGSTGRCVGGRGVKGCAAEHH